MAKFETLVDIFTDAVKTYPDNPLFGTKKDGTWSWMTYLEFGKAVDGFRAGLSSLGVGRGDRVVCIANNRPEWAIAAYACYGLGAAFVPMYEAQTAKDWEFIIKDCDAKIVLAATDGITDKLLALEGAIPSVQHVVSMDPATKTTDKVKSFKELRATAKKVPSIKPDPEDTAGFIYTSGTTGNPKGVILSHTNIASNVSAMHAVFPMSPMDRSLSFLPWAHVFGQTVELHGLLSMGASMAIAESVEKILDNLAETKPTLLFSVPRIFNKLYAAVQKQISSKPPIIQNMVKSALASRAKQRKGEEVGVVEGLVLAITDKVVFSKVRARFGGQLKYAFSGGAAISTEVAEFIDSLGVTVYEGYGLSETSPIATANWPNNRKIGSVGKAIPGVSVSISDDGEIVVHGPNVMKGYHNRPDENAAVRTADGGFKTGDMGRIDKDGFLFITGRLKEQYKLENGKYVVPTPLEEQLKLSPLVLNCMVYGDNKPYNVALVVANVDALKKWASDNGLGESDPDKLLAHTKVRGLMKKEIDTYGEKFKGFEGVKDFALIGDDFTTENGLLTPSLKVKRRQVTDKYKDVIESLYEKKKEKAA
ncbi:MAG: long-chain fatty acid--CoA ligase [Labilithrix sp.]|nr:long-chain fatty acid--CoA ligase [Labilithrix sp.]MCW5814551.1 long-chain fatty acid--CoA ligase [Labilithrix sp.]